MAYRTLVLDQSERDRVSAFPKQRFEILTYAADREARKLSDLIAGGLQSSGWTHIGTAPNSPDGTLPLITGVRVEIPKFAGSAAEKAANTLASVFAAEHLSDTPA